VVFTALVVAFAAALLASVLRPAAYEVRGALVARPASNLIVVRHEAVDALGMAPMELMAILVDPAVVDRADVRPGDRVRLAVRRKNDDLTLLRIEKLP
jgi:Cu/Ag efflux protein CusF